MKHIFITGASGYIGMALALEYAASNIKLTLHGRKKEALEELAQKCKSKGAEVDIVTFDVQDKNAVDAWFDSLITSGISMNFPDLVIANAGIFTAVDREKKKENYEDAEKLLKINILATTYLVDKFLPTMIERKSGQIALVSSVAGYYGLPTLPSYSASKAFVRVYADGLRVLLKNEGVKINSIMPGCITSPMLDDLPGPHPFEITPEKAAQIIKKGLDKNKARIAFPFPLFVGMWFLSFLPAWFTTPIVRFLYVR